MVKDATSHKNRANRAGDSATESNGAGWLPSMREPDSSMRNRARIIVESGQTSRPGLSQADSSISIESGNKRQSQAGRSRMRSQTRPTIAGRSGSICLEEGTACMAESRMIAIMPAGRRRESRRSQRGASELGGGTRARAARPAARTPKPPITIAMDSVSRTCRKPSGKQGCIVGMATPDDDGPGREREDEREDPQDPAASAHRPGLIAPHPLEVMGDDQGQPETRQGRRDGLDPGAEQSDREGPRQPGGRRRHRVRYGLQSDQDEVAG